MAVSRIYVSVQPTDRDDQPPALFMGRVDSSRLFLDPESAPKGTAEEWALSHAVAHFGLKRNMAQQNGGAPVDLCSPSGYGTGWHALPGFVEGVLAVDDGMPRRDGQHWTLREHPFGRGALGHWRLTGPFSQPDALDANLVDGLRLESAFHHDPVWSGVRFLDHHPFASRAFGGSRRREEPNDITWAEGALAIGALVDAGVRAACHPAWALLSLLQHMDLPNGAVFPERRNNGWACLFNKVGEIAPEEALAGSTLWTWYTHQRIAEPNALWAADALADGPRLTLAESATEGKPARAFGAALARLATDHREAIVHMLDDVCAARRQGDERHPYAPAEGSSAHVRLQFAGLRSAVFEAARATGVVA